MLTAQTSSVSKLDSGYHAGPRLSLLWRSSARISALHAIELRWRFENPPLVGLPESGFSGQLERAALFSAFGMQPCKKCGGTRASPDGGTTEKNGTGWAPCGRYATLSYREALRRFRRDYAKKNRISVVKHQRSVDLMGVLFDDLSESERNKPGKTTWLTEARFHELIDSLPLEVCRQCPACGGDGMVERRSRAMKPVTAQPTGSSKSGSGKEPSVTLNETALVRYGWLTRVLDAVTRRSHWSRGAVEVYFSEGGGSTAALWRYTEEGQKFLKKLPNKLNLPPDALFEEERELQKKSPTLARERSLAAIIRETEERWDEACRTWNDSARDIPAPHLERRGE